jgi:hypothetical protein
MSKMRAAGLGACVIVAIAGCARDERPYPARSLKDPVVAPQPNVVAPQPNVVERAKAEQANHCGQRHVDRSKDALNETEELKRERDERCTELHRHDYVE